MWRKIWNRLAPSMVAASYSDGGTVCKPARSVIATNGMPRQILAKITDQRAFHGLPRKSMLPDISPRWRSDQEMMENWASNNHQNAIADSTVGTMKGMSTIARMRALNGMFSFKSSAR